MARKFDHLTPGTRIGEWTVIARAERGTTGNHRLLCRCSCGYEAPIDAYSLIYATSKACRTCAQAIRRATDALRNGPQSPDR